MGTGRGKCGQLESTQHELKGFFKHQALVVQKLDSAIQPLNQYPVNKY